MGNDIDDAKRGSLHWQLKADFCLTDSRIHLHTHVPLNINAKTISNNIIIQSNIN